MPDQIEITPYHWAGFIVIVLLFLSLDLGVFHRRAHVVKFKEALTWTTFWFVLSLVFCGALLKLRNRDEALEFFTGYIIELSLSMDNVFVMAVIFGTTFSVAIILALTLAQEVAEDRIRGRVMGAVQTLFRVGLGLGALGIGAVAHSIGEVHVGITLDGNQVGLIAGGVLILLGALASSGVTRQGIWAQETIPP